MAREKDGWVRFYANLLLKGLNGNQVAYYTVATLIADPKGSTHPGKLDVSDRNMALLLEWGHQKAARVKKQLLERGMLISKVDGIYINGYQDLQSKDFISTLTGNKFPLREILTYKRNQHRFHGVLKTRVDDNHPLDRSGSPSSTSGLPSSTIKADSGT